MTSPPAKSAAVYVFRDQSFSRGGDTIVCAAPRDVVVSVFGSGGLFDTDGLSTAFGGSAVFRDEAAGEAFLAVWGARKASRFRNRLREVGFGLKILHERPPGRLIVRGHGRTAKDRV